MRKPTFPTKERTYVRKKGNQQTKKMMRMMTRVLAALMLSLRDSFLEQEWPEYSYIKFVLL